MRFLLLVHLRKQHEHQHWHPWLHHIMPLTNFKWLWKHKQAKITWNSLTKKKKKGQWLYAKKSKKYFFLHQDPIRNSSSSPSLKCSERSCYWTGIITFDNDLFLTSVFYQSSILFSFSKAKYLEI